MNAERALKREARAALRFAPGARAQATIGEHRSLVLQGHIVGLADSPPRCVVFKSTACNLYTLPRERVEVLP